MANPEHLAKLKEGAEAWNEWRDSNSDLFPDLREAKLRGADLRGFDLSDTNLTRANFRDANLRGVNLNGSNLTGANLRAADLSQVDLSNADIMGGDLRDADLSGIYLSNTTLNSANLRNATLTNAQIPHASLSGANLAGAELHFARLLDTDLTGANFRDARFSNSALEAINLTAVNNLETTVHGWRSSISSDCLEMTAHGLKAEPGKRGSVEKFLRAAGVSEPFLQLFPTLIANPIEFYSAFISYSHVDQSFARRLYDTLQGRGIRCWLDEHQILPGDDIRDRIDRGIKIWDKTLLCCSRDALEKSWWVEQEIDKAQDKEAEIRKKGEKALALIPLDLDGFVHKWDNGRASMLKNRKIADFIGWKNDSDTFDASLEKVIAALRTDEGGRPEEPEPKLGK